ncbi:MAG: hypothetical protein ACRER5_03040 [Pseudomonas sp.]
MSNQTRLNAALAKAFADDPANATRAHAAVAPIVAALEEKLQRLTALARPDDRLLQLSDDASDQWKLGRDGAVLGGPEVEFPRGVAQRQIAMFVVPQDTDDAVPVATQTANAELAIAAVALVRSLITASRSDTEQVGAAGTVLQAGVPTARIDRTLTDDELALLDVNAINGRLSSYRVDLRASAADAQRFVELWNQHKASTTATLVADRAAGWYQVAILDK